MEWGAEQDGDFKPLKSIKPWNFLHGSKPVGMRKSVFVIWMNQTFNQNYNQSWGVVQSQQLKQKTEVWMWSRLLPSSAFTKNTKNTHCNAAKDEFKFCFQWILFPRLLLKWNWRLLISKQKHLYFTAEKERKRKTDVFNLKIKEIIKSYIHTRKYICVELLSSIKHEKERAGTNQLVPSV